VFRFVVYKTILMVFNSSLMLPGVLDYFKRLGQNYLKDILSFNIELPEEQEQCSTVHCSV